MPTVLTPVDTFHATATAPAPLDAANGTEIGDMGQPILDNTLWLKNRIGSHRLIAEDGLSITTGTNGALTQLGSDVTATTWQTIAGTIVTLTGVLTGDIIVCEALVHLKQSASGIGAVRFGGDVPVAVSNTWAQVYTSTGPIPVTLRARGVATGDGSVAVSLGGIVSAGAMSIFDPIQIHAYALRAVA